MSFYSDLALDADGMLSEFGLPIILTRTVEGPYDPNTSSNSQTTTNQTGVGVLLEYADATIDGTLIQRGDRKVLLSSIGVTAPIPGDRVFFAGATFNIVPPVKAVEPAGVVVLYELQVRA